MVRKKLSFALIAHKIKLLFVLFLVSTNTYIYATENILLGQTVTRFFKILPEKDTLYANTIFLITYDSKYFNIADQLSDNSFYLENKRGKKVKLKILEKLNYNKNIGQIVVKISGRLKKNHRYKFGIGDINLPEDRSKRLLKLVDRHEWLIKNEIDKSPPEFLSKEVQWKYSNYYHSSASGHGFSLYVSHKDNGIEHIRGQKDKAKYIIEISDTTGKKLFQTMRGTSFSIYENYYSSIFPLKFNKEYSFQLRLMDYSGNFSSPRFITLKTGKWKDEEVEIQIIIED